MNKTNKEEKCTCNPPMNKETIESIGHFLDCPLCKTPKVEEWEIKLTQLVSLAWKNGLWHSESNFMNDINHFISQVIEEERRQTLKNIVEIIQNSKATFFGTKDSKEPSTEDQLYELKAEICTNCELYFINKINPK